MYKCYLNNQSHWFNTKEELNQFMVSNPNATLREFAYYFNGNEWVRK